MPPANMATPFMFREEKIELVIDGVAEDIMNDQSLPEDIRNRIHFKKINDDAFRYIVARLIKVIFIYCTIAAVDKTGVGLMNRADAKLPAPVTGKIDSDVLLMVNHFLMVNSGPTSELAVFAGSCLGVGQEIFSARIKALQEQLC